MRSSTLASTRWCSSPTPTTASCSTPTPSASPRAAACASWPGATPSTTCACARTSCVRCLPPTASACATKCSTRSEEHTSELQSLMRISYAVFCLKKKTKNEPQIEKRVAGSMDFESNELHHQEHVLVVLQRPCTYIHSLYPPTTGT